MVGSGQDLAHLAAEFEMLLAQRHEIVGRALRDAHQLLLLLGAGVDRPGEAVDDALDPPRRQESPAGPTEAAVAPARAIVAIAAKPAARAVVVAEPARDPSNRSPQ